MRVVGIRSTPAAVLGLSERLGGGGVGAVAVVQDRRSLDAGTTAAVFTTGGGPPDSRKRRLEEAEEDDGALIDALFSASSGQGIPLAQKHSRGHIGGGDGYSRSLLPPPPPPPPPPFELEAARRRRRLDEGAGTLPSHYPATNPSPPLAATAFDAYAELERLLSGGVVVAATGGGSSSTQVVAAPVRGASGYAFEDDGEITKNSSTSGTLMPRGVPTEIDSNTNAAAAAAAAVMIHSTTRGGVSKRMR